MEFFSIIVMTIIVEGIITYVKEFFVNGNLKWQMLGSIAVGIYCSTVYGIDLFQTLGMTSIIPYTGCILTGILISRGSNYIFDLINKLKASLED